MKDHWKNRSKGMRCATCVFFVQKKTLRELEAAEERTEYIATADERGVIGRCRRHAPTMNGFPVVYEADWCGDHRLDENK